jgi:hypothetical protein
MIYNFPTHTSGDTFEGVQFALTVNSTPADLTSAIIDMTVTPTNSNTVTKTFSTTTGEITLTTPASGIFTFNKQVVTLDPDVYKYDITIVFSDGSIKTYIKGIWKII